MQKKRGKMLTLETERLLLRDFSLEDWEAINAIVSDPEVTRYMHFFAWDEARRREWLEWMVQYASNPQRDAYNWAITLRSNSMLIGWLGIGGSSHEEGARSFGYALGPRFWGHGYMTETCGPYLTMSLVFWVHLALLLNAKHRITPPPE